jgi:enamine deaminase RidA (YjgF/YER057c/UK114 family)
MSLERQGWVLAAASTKGNRLMASTRTHSWPEGHWDWPIHVSHKHGIRCGEMMFVGGQVDLDSRGTVLHAGDIETQTAAVMANLDKVLRGLGADLGDLVKLIAFYRNDGSGNEQRFLANVARQLPDDRPGPAITAVPLPALAYPGMLVEIEAVAMRGVDGRRLERQAIALRGTTPLPSPLSHGIRCGEMIFVSGLSATDESGAVVAGGDMVRQSQIVMDRIGEVLHGFGATHADAVKINSYYAGAGQVADWEGAARVRARYFDEPGPAATGIPLPRHALPGLMTRSEITAMLGRDQRRLPRVHVWPEGHWDWPIHLPYKHGIRCGPMIYLGGQVALTPKGDVIEPGDLVAQTRIAMENIRRVLAGFGAGFDEVVKVTAFYQGDASADQLHKNLSIRSGCFTEPGPATTGIPLPFLSYEKMAIEIEAVAMLG